jgi:hypothetical protein
MRFRACSCADELKQALKDGHFPQGCSRELRAHVEVCDGCGDLVLVTQTFQRARSESEQETLSGSPGLLWWRAQLRRRAAAAERVNRPLTIAQSFALLVYGLLGTVFLRSQYRYGLHWASWRSDLTASHGLHLWSRARPEGNLLLLISCLGTLALLSGIVLYLARARE